jgi:hypothetical protein
MSHVIEKKVRLWEMKAGNIYSEPDPNLEQEYPATLVDSKYYCTDWVDVRGAEHMWFIWSLGIMTGSAQPYSMFGSATSKGLTTAQLLARAFNSYGTASINENAPYMYVHSNSKCEGRIRLYFANVHGRIDGIWCVTGREPE